MSDDYFYQVRFSPAEGIPNGPEHGFSIDRFEGDLEVKSGGALIFRRDGVIDAVIGPGAYTHVVRVLKRPQAQASDS